MADIRNGQTRKIPAQDFQLGSRVTDNQAEDEEKPVEIGELVGESYAARMDFLCGLNILGVWDLARCEIRQVHEGEGPAGDSGVVSWEMDFGLGGELQGYWLDYGEEDVWPGWEDGGHFGVDGLMLIFIEWVGDKDDIRIDEEQGRSM